MNNVAKVPRYIRLITILFFASALWAVRPEAGQGSSYEETPGMDFSDERPDPGAVAVSEEAAIRLAKEMLPAIGNKNPDDIALVYDRKREFRLPIPVWKYAWDILDKGTIAQAELDAMTGDLLAFESRFIGNPMNEPNSKLPARITRDQAKAAAVAFVRKADPSLRHFELKEQPFVGSEIDYVFPLFGPARYSFLFGLTVNGYEVGGASLAIIMDTAGNVKFFSFTGDPGQPVAKRPALQADEAKRMWEDGFAMKPFYRNVNESNGQPVHWKLVYEMDRALRSIDAMKRNPAWSDNGWYSELTRQRYGSITQSASAFTPRKVDRDEAVRAAAELANFPADTEWASQYDRYDDNGERETWELRGVDPRDREGGHYSLTVDAKTGQVLQYADYRYREPSDGNKQANPPTIKIADARRLAERWMAEHIPDFAVRYKLAVPSEYPGEVSELRLEYQMFQDGIPVVGQRLAIKLDGNGKMVTFTSPSQTPSIKNLKALKPTIDETRAKQLIVERTKLQPFYFSNRGYPFTYNAVQAAETRLDLLYLTVPANSRERYAPESVDAVTGLVLSVDSGDVWTAGGPLPADARSHPSKVALQTLFDRGVLMADAAGKLLPDAEISRGEFIRMVHRGISLKGYPYLRGEGPLFSDVDVRHSYYNDIGYFVERKWLSADPKIPFKADNPLTREQMAVWLTRIIGYEKISRSFADDPAVARLRDAATLQNKGAAAVMLKIGLMKPMDGSFKPGSRVTRSEAAETLLKLAEIQAQLDRPLWLWGYGGDEYRY